MTTLPSRDDRGDPARDQGHRTDVVDITARRRRNAAREALRAARAAIRAARERKATA